MTISIRALSPDDVTAVTDLDGLAFAGEPEAEPAQFLVPQLDWSRTFGAAHADLAGELAGVYSSFDLTLTAPGPLGTLRAHPLSGLTWVGVHADVRRRGVLSAMIRHHLADLRDRGEAVSGLHASEGAIYGRFGYAVASLDVSFTLGRGTTLRAPAPVEEAAAATTTRTLLDVDDDEVVDRFHALDIACDTSALGRVRLPQAVVRRYVRDVPAARRGREPKRAFVATRGGVDVGAAIFARERTWDDGSPGGTVKVLDLAYRDDAALLAIARRLLDIDLMGKTEFHGRGLDDPLLAWVGGPRGTSMRVCDALWLRPVDVAGMLTSRGYAAACDVVLDVTDETCPWNAGRWRLTTTGDGEAVCARTSDTADVRARVQALGALHLGLRGPLALAAAGELTEQTPGTLAALTAAFATGTAPIGGSSF